MINVKFESIKNDIDKKGKCRQTFSLDFHFKVSFVLGDWHISESAARPTQPPSVFHNHHVLAFLRLSTRRYYVIAHTF